MVSLIIGKEGKGKTKALLDKVNNDIKEAIGSVVYLDRSTKHMFELNNKVRLINVADYDFIDADEFVGFIYGILSQDHDIQQMYVDGILKIAKVGVQESNELISRLDKISEKFKFDLIISVSVDESELSDELKEKVIVSL